MSRPFIFFILTVLTLSCKASVNLKLTSDEIKKTRLATNLDRAEKDIFFTSSESPLDYSLKTLFHGLEYFTFDSVYTFKLKLNRYDKPRELEMITSKGKVKRYIEYGYFDFELDGSQRLNVYRPKPALEGHPNYLFIPFKDATTGKETYPAGRYMELSLNESGGDYVLDFNSAYNPWCAYSDNYNCPYPPKENVLSIPIHAGEKKFRLREH